MVFLVLIVVTFCSYSHAKMYFRIPCPVVMVKSWVGTIEMRVLKSNQVNEQIQLQILQISQATLLYAYKTHNTKNQEKSTVHAQ